MGLHLNSIKIELTNKKRNRYLYDKTAFVGWEYITDGYFKIIINKYHTVRACVRFD